MAEIVTRALSNPKHRTENELPKFIKNLTPARARLRGALESRATALAGVALVQSRIDRLESIVAGAEPARSALAAHDASQAQRLAAWASSTDGADAPKPDAEKRSALACALADAEAQSAAATAAMADMQADARIAGVRSSAAHKEARVVSKMVLLDEAEATLAPLADAIAKVFAEKRKVDAARQSILAELRADDDAHREIFVGLGEFDRARHDAEGVPATPSLNEFFSDWHALAASLLQSAEAALGDVPVAPLPAYQRIEMPDPVVAAAAAAAAFPSSSVQRRR